LKYRPNGGFCFFALNDPAPMVSWSVLDHARVAKLGYHAVTEACRPVVIVADPLPDSVVVGDEIVLDVHVVNDLRRPIIEAEAEAVVTWHGGSSSWRFGGEVGADECVKVGRVRFTVPDTLGELRLDLAFSTRSPGDDVTASNRYTTAVTVL
jgi:beta-mannosidase